MNQKIQNKAIEQRKYKITVLFLLLILAMAIFLSSILKTISTERKVPSYNKTIHDRSFRGDIISADKYTLSNSNKTYQAVIRGSSIKPAMKETFIRLFSIYSGIAEKKLLKQFLVKGKPKRGNIILSRTINSARAMQLKALALKLRRLGVFQSIKIRSGIDVLYGLDIIENGETRRFPLKDVMSPILGYVGKKYDEKYTRPEGKKGLERHYNEHITSKKDGFFKGKRDVLGAIIHDKNSINSGRVDGLNLHLNIPLALQRRVELMIDAMKKNVNADEILVGVMESRTGKVLSLASTERYDPSRIKQADVPKLNPKFSEYPYEAGSVIKPLTLAIALDKNKVTPEKWFNTYNGKMKIGEKRTITDDEKFDSLTATDIIVHSSNVGISQISWRLSGKEFREGLLDFGIARPSGIDLSRDLPGQLKPLYLLEHKMHRANSAYGYGMMVTFAQLFKAYSAFNNEGVISTPRIVSYLADGKGKQYTLKPKIGNSRAISKKTAKQMHNILRAVVTRGTGKKAKYPGLEIGGKTGTAHIAKHGRYVREYHSSFYGFANDKEGHKYTIGVLVVRAKKGRKYFASQSAVPTFKNIVKLLVKQGHLKPDQKEIEALNKKETKKQAKEDDLYDAKDEPSTTPNPSTKDPKKQSVKELFKLEPTAKSKEKSKTKVKTTPKPKKVKSKKKPKDLFNDLDMF